MTVKIDALLTSKDEISAMWSGKRGRNKRKMYCDAQGGRGGGGERQEDNLYPLIQFRSV